MIEIPAMMIAVHLSYSSEGASSEGSKLKGYHEIKTVTLETDVKKIDSCGEASKRSAVASFPQLISHVELGLSDALAEGRSLLVIHIEMNVRS